MVTRKTKRGSARPPPVKGGPTAPKKPNTGPAHAARRAAPRQEPQAAKIARLADELQEEELRAASMGAASTGYRREFARRVTSMCILGLNDEEIAERFEVVASTIQHWRRTIPEFRAAMWEGREGADEEVANALRLSAIGYKHEEDDIRTVALGNNQGSEIVITKTIKHYPPNPASIGHWMHAKQRTRFPSPQSQVASGGLTPTDLAAQARAAIRAALATTTTTSEEGDEDGDQQQVPQDLSGEAEGGG